MKRLGLWMRLLRNTFIPIQVTVQPGALYFGAKVFEADANMWSEEGRYSPANYEALDEKAEVLLEELMRVSSPEQQVLDMCCNIGRHLDFLSRSGYRNLSGFDVMRQAVENYQSVFPSLGDVPISLDRADSYLKQQETSSLDWIFTRGATVELIHPSLKLHKELFRIVRPGGGVVFLIKERKHAYPRFWRYLFSSAGFRLETSLTIDSDTTLLTWRKPKTAAGR